MRHFWGIVIILVEIEVARSTDFALHCVTICVTEKNTTNTTSHVGVVI